MDAVLESPGAGMNPSLRRAPESAGSRSPRSRTARRALRRRRHQHPRPHEDRRRGPPLLVDINRAAAARDRRRRARRALTSARSHASADVADAPATFASTFRSSRIALEQSASPQLRNMATIGGNFMQRTRCPYFRDAAAAVQQTRTRQRLRRDRRREPPRSRARHERPLHRHASVGSRGRACRARRERPR